ncbi:hypothetical protein ACWET9_02885 [Streptomyces sp. NPDC004059]
MPRRTSCPAPAERGHEWETDRHARALRRVVTDLALTGTGTTYLVTKISGSWQRSTCPATTR